MSAATDDKVTRCGGDKVKDDKVKDDKVTRCVGDKVKAARSVTPSPRHLVTPSSAPANVVAKQRTKIEWCHYTFNPWIGCTKVLLKDPAEVEPLCVHCYAESEDKRRGWTDEGWGKGKPRHRTSAANWKKPLLWDVAAAAHRWAKCQTCGKAVACSAELTPSPCHPVTLSCSCGGQLVEQRPRVFCASLADWLDDEAGVPIEWLCDLLELIRRTPHLDWLLLTKRPQNWRPRVIAACKHNENNNGGAANHTWMVEWLAGRAPANVWLGCSVGTQRGYEERMAPFLSIPPRVHFLSMEPLLERVEFAEIMLTPSLVRHPFKTLQGAQVDWIIAGGESGPKARPTHPQWLREVRDVCAANGVPFFFKQWGEWVVLDAIPFGALREAMRALPGQERYISYDGKTHAVDQAPCSSYLIKRVGKGNSGRLLDGVEHSAFPIPRGGALAQ